MNVRDWISHFMIGAIVVTASLVPTLGCGAGQAVATPQDLQQLGTRRYRDRTVDEVHTAVVTALKLQGYEVVTEQPMIRTSPKLVAVSATASGSAYGANAQSFGESVAWDIDVSDQAGTVVVSAKHRASVNGMAMDQVWESWAVTNYKQLFDAIESSLPKAADSASVPASTASTTAQPQ
jgi:hypothetical protein